MNTKFDIGDNVMIVSPGIQGMIVSIEIRGNFEDSTLYIVQSWGEDGELLSYNCFSRELIMIDGQNNIYSDASLDAYNKMLKEDDE